MSTINELYHYGVKGMKWKNHKYAINPEEVKRRINNASWNIRANGAFGVTHQTRRHYNPDGSYREGFRAKINRSGPRMSESSRSLEDRLRSRIGEEKNKAKRKVAGLRDKVSAWMDRRRNIELRDYETGKKTAYKKNGKWYSAKDRAKKTKANGSGTKKAMSRAAGYTKAQAAFRKIKRR